MSINSTSIVDRTTFHKGGRTGILLIHGLGGTPVEVRFIAQGLARAGFTVMCCQLAGHCGTPDDLRKSTWRDWCASVEQAHDRLKRECDTIIAGGLSTGALLAIDLADKRPGEVHGLTLFSPSIYLDGWAMPWYMPWLHYLRASVIKLDWNLTERPPYGLKDERVRAMAVSGMQKGKAAETGYFFTPLWTMLNFNSLSARVRRKFGRISTPTLILHPRQDDVASLKNALEIQRKMAGLVELVVLEDTYHMITLEGAPAGSRPDDGIRAGHRTCSFGKVGEQSSLASRSTRQTVVAHLGPQRLCAAALSSGIATSSSIDP